jgi:hypothetical protein
MKTRLTLFLLFLLFPLMSEAQTYCQNLGTLVICDGGSTTIVPLGPNGGVITQDDQRVMPYSILPGPSRPGSGIQPLRELERLPDSRRPDPFADELRPPFDLRPGDGLLILPE